jgi:hypothetical protein
MNPVNFPAWHEPLRNNWVNATFVVVILNVWLALISFRAFPDPQGTDFYPLWIGAQALVNGADPYAPATMESLRKNWSVAKLVQVSDVIGYPLPVLILVAPLTMLSLESAVYVWFFILLGSVAVFILAFDWKRPIFWIIPLLSFPLVHALTIKTTAVLWLGLIGLLRIAIEKNFIVTSGFCMALLPGKPQAGLVFALAAAIWALRNNRSVLIWAFLWLLVLWGGSIIVQPQWPSQWWRAVQIYREQVFLVWLLPQGLVLPLFSRSLSWFAIVAATQVISFPANDIYSSLPLLVGWMEIGGSLALVGVSCSLLASVIFQNPNQPAALWLTVFLPYCACGLFHSFAKVKEANRKETNEERQDSCRMLEEDRP